MATEAETQEAVDAMERDVDRMIEVLRSRKLSGIVIAADVNGMQGSSSYFEDWTGLTFQDGKHTETGLEISKVIIDLELLPEGPKRNTVVQHLRAFRSWFSTYDELCSEVLRVLDPPACDTPSDPSMN